MRGDGDEHGSVGSWVTSKCAHIGLHRHSSVAADVLQGNVGCVELGDEHGVTWSIGQSGSRSDVAVVRSNALADVAPRQVDRTTRVGERNRAVAADGWSTVFANDGRVEACVAVRDASVVGRVGSSSARVRTQVGVDLEHIGLVDDSQCREVLPRQTSVVGRAAGNVRCKQSPGPTLRNTDFEPNGHREKTIHLAESELLASLGGDGLQQQGRGLARIQVSEEAIDTRLTESGELLAEIDELSNRGEWVVVCALFGSLMKSVMVKGAVYHVRRGELGRQDVPQHREC